MAIRVIAAVLARVLAAPSPDHHDSHSSILWMVLVPRLKVAALRVAIRVITDAESLGRCLAARRPATARRGDGRRAKHSKHCCRGVLPGRRR